MGKYISTAGRCATDDRLFAFMVERARFRDHLYFCSDHTAALALGVSQRTIFRARRRLEAAGRVVREGLRQIGPCRATVVYSFPKHTRRKPRVIQRSSTRSTRSRTNYVRSARAGQPRRKWRILMGEITPAESGTVARPNATPGQALFTAIVDELTNLGVTVPRASIAVSAKHGAAALKDGVTPDVVLAGCLMALRQGKGRFTADYISEVAMVKAGQHLSPKEYAEQIERYKRESDPQAAAARALLEQALAKTKKVPRGT